MSDKKRVGMVSLGCPKNLVDSEVMMGLLARQGYELTTDSRAADVLVVNTCGFIDSARQESVDTILEMAELKTDRQSQAPDRRGLSGRALSRRPEGEIPEIDACIGVNQLKEIESVVEPNGHRILPVYSEGASRAGALSLRRNDSAAARHGSVHGLCKDRRGLRSHLRVLHHPEVARRLSQPLARIHPARS